MMPRTLKKSANQRDKILQECSVRDYAKLQIFSIFSIIIAEKNATKERIQTDPKNLIEKDGLYSKQGV